MEIKLMSKVLWVKGDDYTALKFEEKYGGKKVSEVIKKIMGSKTEAVIEKKDFYAELEVLDVGEVDQRFVKFVRDNVQDYDGMKHENFYFEEDVIE